MIVLSCLCTWRMFTRVRLAAVVVAVVIVPPAAVAVPSCCCCCCSPLVAVVEASYLSMAMAELGRFINLAAALTLTRSTHFRPRQAGQGNQPETDGAGQASKRQQQQQQAEATATRQQVATTGGKRKSQLGNLNDDNEK